MCNQYQGGMPPGVTEHVGGIPAGFTEPDECNTHTILLKSIQQKRPTHFTYNGTVKNMEVTELNGFIDGLLASGVKTHEFVIEHPSFFYTALLEYKIKSEMQHRSLNYQHPLSITNFRTINKFSKKLLAQEWEDYVIPILNKNTVEYIEFIKRNPKTEDKE